MPASRQRIAGGPGNDPWIAVAGTRPNYVKLAPLMRAASAVGRRLDWIDTGQHTAAALTSRMIRDLGLPAPCVALRGPKTHRVARMALQIGKELETRTPSLVVVVGDVDSTLAGALAAWRLDLPLVHIEAGLRSFERDMPEERNRVLVDAISDRLYLSEPQAAANLRAEGYAARRWRQTGNVMADALWMCRTRIEADRERWSRRLAPGGYLVATLHRQANVDDPRRLEGYLRAFMGLAQRGHPVVFPVHPRTRKRLAELGLGGDVAAAGVRLLPPLPYLEFLGLVAASAAVITDSGGLQVEAALLRVPCVTARRTTEHRLTLTHARNIVAGTDPRSLRTALRRACETRLPGGGPPRAWDGHAAERIVEDLARGFTRPARLPGLDTELLRAAGVH